MTDRPIYLDNHSTTRVDPRVVEAMLPYFTEAFGNAASTNHAYGWEANSAVDAARAQIGELLHVDRKTIIFTSGATEANNLALKGIMRQCPAGSHCVVNAAEHKAILDPAQTLVREGFKVTVVPVDGFGVVDPQVVADAIQPDTVLVSTMLANNEVGSINPIKEIASLCRSRGIIFHSDATQAVGREPIDLTHLPIDLLSFSAHKLYGPKGVGALYVSRRSPRIQMKSELDGGGHERRLRSGTLPVPLIVGFGVACDLCRKDMLEETSRLRNLRIRLTKGLFDALDDIELNGHPEARLPGNAHISFSGVNSEALMVRLKSVVAVSSGSACTTADPEPSHVLLAMKKRPDQIESAIRFGIGRFNTAAEIETVVQALTESVRELRRVSEA